MWNKSGQVNPKDKLKSTTGTPEVQHVIRSAAYVAAVDAVCLVTGEDNILFFQREGLCLYKQVSRMLSSC